MNIYNRLQNKLTAGVPHNAQFKEIVFSHTYRGEKMYRLRFFVFDQELAIGESIATNKAFPLEQITALFKGKSEDSMVQSKWAVTLGQNPKRPDLLTIVAFAPHDFAFTPEFIAYQCAWQGCLNGEPDTPLKKEYLKDREQKEAKFAATLAARQNLNTGLRGELPAASYEFFFGCSHKDLVAHIEEGFQPDWSWKNRGRVWHLDHTIPLRDFDLLDPSEELKANHFTNLRAISREENLRKHANSADLALAN